MTCSKCWRQITKDKTRFMGLELVKRLIKRSMMHILTQTHVKSFTPNTPHVPLNKVSESIVHDLE